MCNKVQSLHLNQFTAFQDAKFEFGQGINVLIGSNSTGKTHVMKALYSALKVCEQTHRKKLDSREVIASLLSEKLSGVFKPNSVGRLVRRGRGKRNSSLTVQYANTKLNVTITSGSKVSLTYARLPNPVPAVYLPSHEFLSMYEGFISAYTQRESSFDETYYDLAVALNALPLRGPTQTDIKSLLLPLEKAVGKSRNVTQENGRFYVRLPEGKLEAHLVSEGLRKLAGLLYLINNGSLTKNGILFWDEPEANLNPKLIMIVVDVLKILAASGVQIFIATHDFLLSQELSLLSEYKSETNVKFFSLIKGKNGIEVESAESLVDIEHDPILDEFAAHYDRESELFRLAIAKR